MSITNSPAFTPYTPSWLSCARRWSAVSSFALPVGSVLAATPRSLLCLLPTGSPMTPALWGVRRMPFGYFCVVQTSALSRRASSCQWLNSRRIRRVNPSRCCLFIVSNIIRLPLPLHLTQAGSPTKFVTLWGALTPYTKRDELLLVSFTLSHIHTSVCTDSLFCLFIISNYSSTLIAHSQYPLA